MNKKKKSFQELPSSKTVRASVKEDNTSAILSTTPSQKEPELRKNVSATKNPEPEVENESEKKLLGQHNNACNTAITEPEKSLATPASYHQKGPSFCRS